MREGRVAHYFPKCSSCGYHLIANETHELKGAYLFPASKLEKSGERALCQMADCIYFFLRPWNGAPAASVERRTRQKTALLLCFGQPRFKRYGYVLSSMRGKPVVATKTHVISVPHYKQLRC